MKEVTVGFNVSASGETYFVPVLEPCRIIDAYLVSETKQTSTNATVKLQKSGASNATKQVTMKDVSAGTPTQLEAPDAASDDEKYRIFNKDVPIEVSFGSDWQTECQATLIMQLDEYLIGGDEDGAN